MFFIHTAKLALRDQAHQIHLTIVHVKPQVCLEKIKNKYMKQVRFQQDRLNLFTVNMYEVEQTKIKNPKM